MAWAVPKYSREQINRAARVLVREFKSPEGPWGDMDRFQEWSLALDVINNWRSSHGYPLNTFQMNLRRSANNVDRSALIAQRTKRITSIAAKLDRFPQMKLTQMQDIGGCRAVLNDVASVRRLAEFYRRGSKIKHIRASVDDYIANPQKSGYRGIHMVYRYRSDKGGSRVYNDLKIEMQLRSQYQHAWATAVETVGTFIQQALKSSIGEADWLRFFALMGTAIAFREGSPPVPDTPVEQRALIAELDCHAQALNVANRLRAYGDALKKIQEGELSEGGPRSAHYYLLRLDAKAAQLTITGFRIQEIAQAEAEYAHAEKYAKDHPGTDAVLVAVDSIAALQRAYPNYFADTRVFLELLDQALTGRPKQIQI